MEILECNGKNIRISRGSITVKGEDGKTRGVVQNITSLYNIQPNKQIIFVAELSKKGINCMNVGLHNIIVKENKLYFFRNIKSKLFQEKYGFFSKEEAKKAEEIENLYVSIKKAGYDVVESVFV